MLDAALSATGCLAALFAPTTVSGVLGAAGGMDWSRLLPLYVAFLLSLSVHESAHAWTAWRLGDPTGKMLGRISLNPIPHMDPIGTVLLPLAMAWSLGGPFFFGYAKPVPYNPYLLKNPALGTTAISGAGPLSNFLLAAVVVVAVGQLATTSLADTLGFEVLVYTVVLNVILGVFNLLPFAPLDGGGVVSGLLPRRAAAAFARFEYVAPILLMVLIVTRLLDVILMPPVSAILRLLFGMVGLESPLG